MATPFAMGFKFKIGDEASKKWIGSINIEDVQRQKGEKLLTTKLNYREKYAIVYMQ